MTSFLITISDVEQCRKLFDSLGKGKQIVWHTGLLYVVTVQFYLCKICKPINALYNNMNQ